MGARFRAILAVGVLTAGFFPTIATAAATQWLIEDGGNGHWYEAVVAAGGITWTDANAAATATGGYLATITSEAENAFVYNLASNVPDLWFVDYGRAFGPWLGGYQSAGNQAPGEDWHWVTGEPWGYTNWCAGEPNDYWGPDENRVQFFGFTPPETSPQWNDTDDSGYPYVVYGYIVETPEPATLSLLALGGIFAFRGKKVRAHR